MREVVVIHAERPHREARAEHVTAPFAAGAVEPERQKEGDTADCGVDPKPRACAGPCLEPLKERFLSRLIP